MTMKFYRTVHFRLLVFLLALLPLASCGSSLYKKIEILSYDVRYVVPTSARSADMLFNVEIENRTVGFTVSGLKGIIRKDGMDIASFRAEDFAIHGKTTESYRLPVQAELCDGVSLLQVLVLAGTSGLDGLTADVEAKASKAGIARTFSVKNKRLNLLK